MSALWQQDSLLDLLNDDQPKPVRFTCEACGGIEPTKMKHNNHGLPLMHEGRLHCREMSNVLSHVGVYMHDFIKDRARTVHCCAFVHKLPDHNNLDKDGYTIIELPYDTDWERMREQRWEHVMHAYQVGLQRWAKHVDAYNVKVIELAMKCGFNTLLTNVLVTKSGRPFTPIKLAFKDAGQNLIEARAWWQDHRGILIDGRVECTCRRSFTTNLWGFHQAGYPTPFKESI